ncbi:MAG TPA: BatD family protein [Chitinophagaceae bacterium]
MQKLPCKIILLLSLLIVCINATAQVIFKTIVQKSTVEVGESFFVQYTVENIEGNDGFNLPYFTGLRLVSGPNIYPGKVNSPDGLKPVKNYVVTLEALSPGRFIIPGASATINGRFIKSDDITIVAVEKEEENASAYFLHPGEDPYEKMRKNLFMKVMVNKKSCYVGEPVVATFKLYSRLQSKSDIVKNPGFYGFSVQDIVSLSDKVSHPETIDGKKFEVHTVRNVQLYPLQAGLFMIDAMEVLNKVEFSKSAVNKKTEQEIIEGVHENREEKSSDNNIVTYESSISTEKITISVKPYPEKNKPPLFSGATGSFTISALLEKKELVKNEEGDLVIIIGGKGNFTQLTAPAIQWPAGVEAFEASVKDSLDKTHIPLKGTRTFRFPFVAGKAGVYTVPSFSFVFFDTDSNKYKTLSTKPVEIKISDREKEAQTIVQNENGNSNKPLIPWLEGTVLLLLLIASAWWFYKKIKTTAPVQTTEEKKTSPGIEERLKPAYIALEKNDPGFYVILQKTIWDHLGVTLHLSGSRMNKQELQKALQAKRLADDRSKIIAGILEECEAAAFTKAEFIHDKQELLARAKVALEQLQD